MECSTSLAWTKPASALRGRLAHGPLVLTALKRSIMCVSSVAPRRPYGVLTVVTSWPSRVQRWRDGVELSTSSQGASRALTSPALWSCDSLVSFSCQ